MTKPRIGKVRGDQFRGKIGHDLDERIERRCFRVEARDIRGLDEPDAFVFVVADRDRELHRRNMASSAGSVHGGELDAAKR